MSNRSQPVGVSKSTSGPFSNKLTDHKTEENAESAEDIESAVFFKIELKIPS